MTYSLQLGFQTNFHQSVVARKGNVFTEPAKTDKNDLKKNKKTKKQTGFPETNNDLFQTKIQNPNL